MDAYRSGRRKVLAGAMKFVVVVGTSVLILSTLVACVSTPRPVTNKTLARALVSTKSVSSRLTAMDAIAASIGVAVEDQSTGHWVVPAGLKPEKVGALYTFELQSVAYAIGQKERIPISTVASDIDNSGFHAVGLEVTPAALSKAITDAARQSKSSSKRDNHGWKNIRIVREIGIAEKGQDLATVAPDQVTSLDPMQAFLIGLDFLEPVLWASGGVSVPSPQTTASPSALGVFGRVAASPVDSQVCEKFKNALDWLPTQVGNVLAAWLSKNIYVDMGSELTLSSLSKLLARWVKTGTAFGLAYDALQTLAISMSISTTVSAAPPMPIVVGSGTTYSIVLKVESLYAFPDLLVNCGYLAGLKLPKKGDVPGVTVLWLIPDDIEFWAGATPEPTAGIIATTTDATGNAKIQISTSAPWFHSGTWFTIPLTGHVAAFPRGKIQGGAGWITGGFVDLVNALPFDCSVTYQLGI